MFEKKLADNDAVKQYEDVLKSVDDMKEEEAKAFLKQIYARLDIVENGNDKYKNDQCVKDLMSKFKDLIRIAKIKEEKNNKEFKTKSD